MKGLSTKAFNMVNGVRSLLFPSACLFCQRPLAPSPIYKGCCSDCFEKVAIWPRSTCFRCGVMLPEAVAPGPCGRCLQYPPPQSESHSIYSYSGVVRDAILAWKLQGQDAGVRWLLTSAATTVRDIVQQHDILLPLPMPLARMRKSGRHHAADLCRWVACEAGCRWDWQVLRRVGEQPRQSALSGVARRQNLRGAFTLADDASSRVSGHTTIWIVDDIMTTGSTLRFAAKAVQPLGLEVKLLSLARTLIRG